ncbi:MAG: DUF167 domain-containing protein [Thaumarchaeota archaeon]|jgi:uncharacterized protein (TIGR00251 family)|nr:DUF167 domain-containing protein [Nitrososphaerota archaeon]NSL74594.1 DUF167 domain-containing protein [Nitrososphaerota archaeon]NSL77073.1 DUF167 domain-containing protein [Nitrososphaerota archaeon]
MDSNHLIIHINVKTGLQDNYLKFEDGQIILGIKSLPLKNKANLEVIKILSKLFRVDDVDVIIIKGMSNNIKTIKIIDPKFIPNEIL